MYVRREWTRSASRRTCRDRVSETNATTHGMTRAAACLLELLYAIDNKVITRTFTK